MYKIVHMGCNSAHSKDFFINRPNGFRHYLALFVKTPAIFTLNGEDRLTEPDMFIVFDKNSSVQYRSSGGEYIDDWIHFDCDEEPEIEFSHPYYFNSQIPVSDYIRLICDAYYRASTKACSALMNAMFSDIISLTGSSVIKGSHYRELAEMRREIYTNPHQDWSVTNMAKRLHVSAAYLQEIYKNTFGISCRADVINSRIEAAKSLLDETSLSVQEVGFRCGYNSAVHFSRQFSLVTGCQPSKWKQRR